MIGGSSRSACNSPGWSSADILAAAGFFAASPLAVFGVSLLMRWRRHPWRSSIVLIGTIIATVIGSFVSLALAFSSSGCID
jgi:hypothetical protein